MDLFDYLLIFFAVAVPEWALSYLFRKSRISGKSLITMSAVLMAVALPFLGVVVGIPLNAWVVLGIMSFSGFGIGLQVGRVIVDIARKEKEAKARLESGKVSQPEGRGIH